MRAKHQPASTPVPSVHEGSPVRIGWLAAGSKPGNWLVDFDGNSAGPLAALSTVALGEAAVREAVATRRPVVLLFEGQGAGRPIIVGMLAPDPAAALLGPLLQRPLAVPGATTSAKPVEARVDGKRVVLEGEQEVVLRCGEASITLRRDGKVVLRGAYVETTAKGVNRIRGGSVKIN